MNQIYEANDNFPLDKISLTTPVVISNGTFFIKYLLNNEPFYIQPPRCVTRQGIIKGGKKMYCDLMFTNENNSFIKWIEDLECYSHKYIFDNRQAWFESHLNLEDIVDSFLSALKIYKSGKFYILRTIVPSHLGKCLLRLYDEQETSLNHDKLVDSTTVIPILEFQGIRCSTRNFQIDIEIKQMMILNPSKLFEKCVIRNNEPLTTDLPDTTLRSESFGTKNDSPWVSSEESCDKSPVYLHGANEFLHNVVEKVKMKPLSSAQEKTSEIKEEEDDNTYEENSELNIDESKVEVKVNNLEELNSKEISLPIVRPPEVHEGLQMQSVLSQERCEKAICDFEDFPSGDKTLQKLNSTQTGNDLEELNLEDEIVNQEDMITLTTRNDIYNKIYQIAMKKATNAKHLAISSYLEAKQIKNLYMLQDDDTVKFETELNEIRNNVD